MHTDLLDTVLVSRKESTPVSESATVTPIASMKDATATVTATATAAAPAEEEAKCPVNHKTRGAWLQQARAAPNPRPATATQDEPGARHQPTQPATSWSSWLRLPFSRSQQPPQPPTTSPQAASQMHPSLDESRVVSTIPRSSEPGPTSCPVNHEQETGASASGNWIYPSEKMFFDAMKRKGFDSAKAADMKTVVPIHNAVNERAWAEILRWEAPYVAPANNACGGPRLHSFAGLSERMTPKARLNTLLGYTAPFDRHDWVIDRCGTQVEYVIDFYAGRNDGTSTGKLNFYLDVRPKLNTWEGIKMRAMRATGLS